MSTSIEVIQAMLNEFLAVQDAMELAREEGASLTYKCLKKRYTYYKAMLQTCSVNLDEIDRMKD